MNKRINVVAITIAVICLALGLVIVGRFLLKNEPVLVQGTFECKQYKASSKVPGRILEMYVEEGQKVAKGDLLYTIATPELDAKMEQAQAVSKAAMAVDAMAEAGARQQQIEGALNLWQKAQAGKELAKKTLDRVKNLYNEGVVPEQKLDEATANYNAMVATEKAAHSQYDMAVEGARKEEKEAAAAKVRQAMGVVHEVESYLKDACIYSPIDGEVSTIISEEGELVGSGYPVVTVLDNDDCWATFNIKEDMLPKIHQGQHIPGYVPALDVTIDLEVTYISVLADFATWSATKAQGSFDIRTFAIKMKPCVKVENVRPGMTAVINWSEIDE